MDYLLPASMITAGFFVGWNIGANDAANCIGTTVGARIISFHKAVAIMAVFVILGGVLQGDHVMKTVGKGIVMSEAQVYQEHHENSPSPEFMQYFPDDRLPDGAILVALLCAGFFVTLATFSRVPVSTSQAIVGGVAGVGTGIVGLQAEYFRIEVILRIVGAWVISPLLTLIMAFGFYWALGKFLRRTTSVLWTRSMGIAVLASAAYVSYSLGANDVGNAIGPLLSKYPDKGMQLAVLGGIAMATGAITAGSRVTDTVGKSITSLDYGGTAFGGHRRTPVFHGRYPGIHLPSHRGRRYRRWSDQGSSGRQHQENRDDPDRLGRHTCLRRRVCGTDVPVILSLSEKLTC